ncbi:putative up-frameshift suppressor 2 [Lyophyllum shimeji]|uniref:Up-frameshift suppressor 2 n=1 Tax=Lyophyllum shimeji TaxID=47721 RepID=A0A9P3PKD9_LYOSH|nr:putative up-frameshift suppressor 2 [Lyophyllum shimeji]
MESTANGVQAAAKSDDEKVRFAKRAKLKQANLNPIVQELSKDSSLKRHTALIKRIRQSLAAEGRDQILKEIDSLSLEKYIDEIAGAVVEGIPRCKTERDVWAAVEVISSLHQRFPATFTPALLSVLSAAIGAPNRSALNALAPEQREKEETARVTRQRPVLRVCSELALVGIIKDVPGRSGGEWIMKALKELLSNDPGLSSLPLLTTFLKSYSRPYLGITPPATSKQTSSESDAVIETDGAFPSLTHETDELVEQDIRDRFKRMCEGYYDNVCKKLVIEHKRLQEQDKRNHEAYIRSGEIFEDRQQAYEKMTKGYEKLLASCQSLSEHLYLPLPPLPTASQKSDSILIGTNKGDVLDEADEVVTTGGKWEDEEERRFFEDVQDLKDFVPSSVLGIDGADNEKQEGKETEKDRMDREKEEVRKLEEELQKLGQDTVPSMNGAAAAATEEEEDIPTPTPSTPKTSTPHLSPQLAPQGPSQLLTALLLRLPECTNRALMDQASIDFAFLNSKAARKRLVKYLAQVPKNRTDLLPHYSRLVATLNKYMPDIGAELVAILDEEFRYLQRKKNVVKELAEVRLKNITYLSNLTKFRVVPSHLILHMFKVCLDDFTGTNVDNIALLLEGCGRFLLRSEETSERFSTMLELMRRKQSMQHFDQRQLLLLENAYYQCNPPERAPRQEKHRTPMELFIRHLIYDVLAKKTIDKVLKLIRKLDWDNEEVRSVLHKVFTKPWKITYSNISLMAMLTNDLQRYHPAFAISVVDQVLEDVRRGLEQNMYSTNQRRVAVMKYLGELYIYRLLSSGIVFDTLWSLVTFGHPDGRPLPRQPNPLDMPDDFFRIRLVCVLLDTCGMCFDRGTQKKKLDNFLVFFQYYIHCKDPMPMDVDFMVSDSLEAVRPKLQVAKTIEEAAIAVDEMFSSAYQNAAPGEDSGDDSGDEGERPNAAEGEEEEEEYVGDQELQGDERAPSPEEEVILSSGKSLQENLGPSEEAEAEFARELAKMVTDTSSDSRKVDKRTALALWDSAVIPPAVRKKKGDEGDEDGDTAELNKPGVMAFTVITKRGNKQHTRQLAVPAESALAVHTRSAQLQDKVEQQHLKRLVLDYEQREEAEELKALEARNRTSAIKIRYVG